MTFQAVPNAAEIVVHGSLDGQDVVNTYQATKAGAWNNVDLANLAEAVDAWVGSHWLPLMAANFEYLNTTCRDLRTPIATEVTNGTHSGLGGEVANGATMNTTLAIKRASAFTGRAARGRVYIPPPPTDKLISAGEINHTYADAVTGALNALNIAIDGIDWVAVIVSRTGPGTSPVAAVVYTIVEYVVVDYILDSMRRRLPKRGT